MLYRTLIFLLIPFISQTQDICKGYFAHQEGTAWTITSYDKKKKEAGKLQYEVLFNEAGAEGRDITFMYSHFDKEGEKVTGGEVVSTCANNTFTTTFSGIMAESFPQTADVQAEISGDLIQYPNQMTAGQKLPDANVVISTKIEDGMSLLKVTTEITNRKVVGFEKIVTPAGTFDCVKITYDAKIKMILTKTISMVEYLAEGIGVVRSESYDKKGELAGYSELSELKRP